MRFATVDSDRIKHEGDYIIATGCTIREAAAFCGMSKSTVHLDMRKRLKEIDMARYSKVATILEFNKEERHLRGGEATKQVWQRRFCKTPFLSAKSKPALTGA